MKKYVKQKVFTYVQSGSLLKLKHYLETSVKKIDEFNINFITGDMQRTPLHVACLLGDDAIARLLLHYGADAEIKDRDGDTPLHLAAKYAGEDGNYAHRKLLVDPLIKNYPDAMDIENKWKETPSDLLRDAKEKYKAFLEAESAPWGEEVGSCYNNQEEYSIKLPISDTSWNEKLTNEWDADCADAGVSHEYFNDEEWTNSVPDYPTFDQWADRMAAEYKKKHLSDKERFKRKKEENRKRKFEKVKDMNDRLEQEREKYRKRMAAKKSELLESRHKDYQEKMSKHVSNNSERKLRFKDIPWPCLGTVKEMMEVIMSGFTGGNDQKDKRKYILKQQMLWHPDKFMQRCSDMLDVNDKDSILDTVKLLSQSLNQMLQ